ncbi:hypothetical protein BCR42DRAFT_36289 [Absidia repens]|uniref:Uncharacterized protein n=1 Tax=Absidia repens TaxID=90262 RepID=A0A1X2IHF0_9FUNG|nr:hypothetical protein BCR42DRAFT_36289 [Absidia repens]
MRNSANPIIFIEYKTLRLYFIFLFFYFTLSFFLILPALHIPSPHSQYNNYYAIHIYGKRLTKNDVHKILTKRIPRKAL